MLNLYLSSTSYKVGGTVVKRILGTLWHITIYNWHLSELCNCLHEMPGVTKFGVVCRNYRYVSELSVCKTPLAHKPWEPSKTLSHEVPVGCLYNNEWFLRLMTSKGLVKWRHNNGISLAFCLLFQITRFLLFSRTCISITGATLHLKVRKLHLEKLQSPLIQTARSVPVFRQTQFNF